MSDKSIQEGVGRLVAYNRQDGLSLEDELFAAFDATQVDLTTQKPPMSRFVDTEALSRLRWDNEALCVKTRIWDYPVRIRANRIVIFPAK